MAHVCCTRIRYPAPTPQTLPDACVKGRPYMLVFSTKAVESKSGLFDSTTDSTCVLSLRSLLFRSCSLDTQPMRDSLLFASRNFCAPSLRLLACWLPICPSPAYVSFRSEQPLCPDECLAEALFHRLLINAWRRRSRQTLMQSITDQH